MDFLSKDKRRRDKWKDKQKRAKPTKPHEPKVEYDRHDKRWIEEQLDEQEN